jgi:SP family galactose:H+ symporter-like MFS transporter
VAAPGEVKVAAPAGATGAPHRRVSVGTCWRSAAAGFNNPTSQGRATLSAVGAVNVVATLVAGLWVDRFARKPLLLIGSAGICVGLLIVAGAFFELQKVTSSEHAARAPASAGILALIGLVIFIASFAFSLGPVVWTVINEVFPARVRGRGVALATAVNWFAAWAVAQTFLTLVNTITTEGTFLLFAGFCVVTFVSVRWFLPETKGKTLEAVSNMWADPAELHRAISTWRQVDARGAAGCGELTSPACQTKSEPPSALTHAPVT